MKVIELEKILSILPPNSDVKIAMHSDMVCGNVKMDCEAIINNNKLVLKTKTAYYNNDGEYLEEEFVEKEKTSALDLEDK